MLKNWTIKQMALAYQEMAELNLQIAAEFSELEEEAWQAVKQ